MIMMMMMIIIVIVIIIIVNPKIDDLKHNPLPQGRCEKNLHS